LDKFATDPECKVFVCSLLAGGLGIDLTAASVCIHVDRWWNPAKENQATDRLHRIGQTRGVQVFKLQIPGTVEDRIASIIESKIELSGTLIEESPLGLKAFSREELLALLTPVD
jgi:SNF2 family DNA or RNA helicase